MHMGDLHTRIYNISLAGGSEWHPNRRRPLLDHQTYSSGLIAMPISIRTTKERRVRSRTPRAERRSTQALLYIDGRRRSGDDAGHNNNNTDGTAAAKAMVRDR